MCSTIIITGSRSLWGPEHEFVRDWLWGQLDRLAPGLVVHGACPRSPDMWAAQWARETGGYVEAMPALWEYYGRSAGMVRNDLMLSSYPDAIVVGVWDGMSRGAGGCLREAARGSMKICSLTTGPDLFAEDGVVERLDV